MPRRRRSYRSRRRSFGPHIGILSLLILATLWVLLSRQNISFSLPGNISLPGISNSSGQCQANCILGTGVQGVRVIVEPEAGESEITGAISDARKSVWVEMYLLTERNVMRALEETAQRGIDVRVMLESHPFGGGGSPQHTLDQLSAAGVKTETTNPDFPLTHEKGMVIDATTVFIMTSNFTRSALGGSSSGYSNREYDIIDTIPQDVQAVSAIFEGDWNRTTPQINDPNLVVSPVNSRNDFTTLINSAHHTLLIEAEEMQDSGIEQALMNAAKRGVRVQVILPAPQGSSRDSNSSGIDAIKAGGAQVREDEHLYMHAKIIVVDNREAFVGSENISMESLDQNRELGIIVSDTNVLSTLEQTFQRDWGDSRSV